VSWDDLTELGGGLLALSGCPQGELARRVRAGEEKGARELLDFLRGTYDGYVAVEVWDHALPEERELADRLLELADRRGIPAVATNDVHYATPAARIVHDVLTCLRHQVRGSVAVDAGVPGASRYDAAGFLRAVGLEGCGGALRGCLGSAAER
jgi:DNA polymerase III alpha subunit